MKDRGVWHNLKEGAFWVAEKSTFITVPLGIFLAGKALLAKEFLQAGVIGAFVGVDLLTYQYFKNRRAKMKGFASLRSESVNNSNLSSFEEYKSRRGSERVEHQDRLALAS